MVRTGGDEAGVGGGRVSVAVAVPASRGVAVPRAVAVSRFAIAVALTTIGAGLIAARTFGGLDGSVIVPAVVARASE
jgi:hypothetical protein